MEEHAGTEAVNQQDVWDKQEHWVTACASLPKILGVHVFGVDMHTPSALQLTVFFPAEARLVSCLQAWEWGCYNTVVTFMPAVGNMVHVYPIYLLNYRVPCTCGQKRRVSWRQLGVQMSVSTERGSVSTTEPKANLPWVVRSSCPLALSSSPQQTPCWSSSSQTCEEGAWSGAYSDRSHYVPMLQIGLRNKMQGWCFTIGHCWCSNNKTTCVVYTYVPITLRQLRMLPSNQNFELE